MNGDAGSPRTAHPAAGEINAQFTPRQFAVVLAVFILASYPEVVLGLQTFFFRDFGFFAYPLAYHHRESFWRGEIPLWNPLNNCGLPFLAQWNTMVLYPGSLFYLLFPLSWSLAVFCLLHQFLAGMGMYGLAFHWTGNRLAAAAAGLSFAFSGVALNCLMWPNNIAALGWMPIVVLSAARAWREGGRMIVASAVTGAVQMLSGAPEIILQTWLFLGCLWLVEVVGGEAPRRLLFTRFPLIVVLVIGSTAAQLFPFCDFLAHSQRDKGFSDSSWSMPVWGLANFLVPLFRCFTKFFGVYAQSDQYWTSSYYVGAGTLALALAACVRARERRIFTLAAIALVSVILAMGDGGYLYAWLRKAVPQFGFVRYPIKFVVLAVFCAPLLGAFFVRRLMVLPTSEAVRAWRPAMVVGGILLIAVGGILGFAYRHPLAYESWAMTSRSGLRSAFFLSSILGATYFLAAAKTRLAKAAAGIGLLFLLGLDGLTHMPRQNPVIPRAAFAPGLLRSSRQAPSGDGRAMISPAAEEKFHHFASANALSDYVVNRLGLFMNCNLLEDIPKVDGLYSMYLRESEKIDRLLKTSPDPARQLSHLLDFLSVAQITAPTRYFDLTNRNTGLPLVTIGQKPFFTDDATAFRSLSEPAFDPRQVVYLPLEAKSSITVGDRTGGRVVAARLAAHRAEIETVASQPSMLVIAQSYYHPWRARVDGRFTQLWRANYAYQALQVPAGKRKVILVYEDESFYWGVVLSLGTLLGCATAWFRTKDLLIRT